MTPNQGFYIEFPRKANAKYNNACMVSNPYTNKWKACYWAREDGRFTWIDIGVYDTWEDAAHAAQLAFDIGLPEPR